MYYLQYFHLISEKKKKYYKTTDKKNTFKSIPLNDNLIMNEIQKNTKTIKKEIETKSIRGKR